MSRRTGDPPWTLKGDMLMDAHGTHLFRLVEQPGLGRHADEILNQIIVAPELLDRLLTALPFVEDALDDPVFTKGVVRKLARGIHALVAKVDAK